MSAITRPLTRGRLIAAPIVALLCALLFIMLWNLLPSQAFAGWTGLFSSEEQKRSIAYAITLDDEWNAPDYASAVVAFDEASGEIVHRISTERYPAAAVSSSGDHVFVLETRISGGVASHILSKVDTETWTTVASLTIPDRHHYPIDGPSGLTFTPDGQQLWVYSYEELTGPGQANYWLAVVDPVALKLLPTQIPLPRCDGAYFAPVGDYFVALCTRSNDVRFIDPTTAEVVATVALPYVAPLHFPGRAVTWAIAEDESTIYVITNDLQIVEIDVASQTLTRTVTEWQGEPGIVAAAEVAAISGDGRSLFVGVRGKPRDSSSPYSLRRFELPSLTLAETIPLPGYAYLVPSLQEGIYLLPQPQGRPYGNAALDTSAVVQFDPERDDVTPLVPADEGSHVERIER